MSGLRFVEPQWAYALWGLLAFVGLLLLLERRGSGALGRLVGAGLQARLVERPGPRRRRLRIVLLTLTCALLIVSLMRPQWGVRPRLSTRLGAEVMVCFDVSRSMLAEDVAPNRLERAKAEVADLLTYLEGNQVGLIAFAGRASVLAPLTPDFGFLHLVLDGLGMHSVTRGGTRLEEPIRKALAGFGPPSAASRAILLITDGEDHDSFPLEAAREAAELGVKIVAIGFGDEAGSEIYVTDPRSGARTLLRDGSGLPVRSRLDGALLREIALVTEGVYVPAGTGLLDLESIFDQHIAPLTQGRLEARGKPVGDDLYQWAILLALVTLVGAVAAPGSAALPAVGRSAWALGLAIGLSSPARSIEPLPAPTAVPEAVAQASEPAAREATGAPEAEASPRELYNRGVAALLAQDFEEAERWLVRARREARDDAELRFRATYDVGWSLARRADRAEADDPQAALGLWREAADRFREAVQLRPEAEDPRANLEVVLRRALALSDRLAQQREGLAERLRELATRQRALLPNVSAVLETVRDDPNVHAVDRLRREFRALATTQRALLADTDRLARDVWDEHDALETRLQGQPAEHSPEESMRSVQLARVLDHLHRTRDRMGQTRKQLRQRHAERAYRRGAAALEGLKRALDQLADPATVLSRVIEDGVELRRATAALGVQQTLEPTATASDPRPAWLTPEFARERNDAISERAKELLQRLEAARGASRGNGAGASSRLAVAALEAAPLVATAQDRLEAASEALASDAFRAAADEQGAALRALLEARERFLDLRGLIETTYVEERGVVEQLAAEEAALPAARTAQARNLARAERLDQRLRDEAQQLDTAGLPEAAGPDAEAARERMALARQITSVARGQMEEVLDALAAERPDGPDRERARTAAADATLRLEALRRLFLSIVERLRELASQQLDLADQTARETALRTDPADDAWGPLSTRQAELARRAEETAWELAEQSRLSAGDPAAGPDAAESAGRLRRAGEHVLSAETAMQEALESMGKAAADPAAPEHQKRALEELARALALLAPPEPPEPGDGEGAPQPDADEAGRGAARAQAPEATPDPAQLLQQVRDREAQRRRRAEERSRIGYERVEKDW